MAVAAVIAATDHSPLHGTASSLVALALGVGASALLALASKLEPRIWACVRPVVQWWSLENVQLLANTAFPAAGAIAALAAVNFFYLEPQAPKVTVATDWYVDATKLPHIVNADEAYIVGSIAEGMSRDVLRSLLSHYNNSQTLAEDCATSERAVTLLAPNACQTSNGLPTVTYPKYLDALISSQYFTGHSGGMDPVDNPHLTDAQLQDAGAKLRTAAVPVDAVTVINNGHVDATSVKMIAPNGVEPLDKGKDLAIFNLPVGTPRTFFYRESDMSISAGDSLPTEGFEVNTSTSTTGFSQELAWRLLLGAGLFLLLLVARDMFRTRTYSGRRKE